MKINEAINEAYEQTDAYNTEVYEGNPLKIHTDFIKMIWNDYHEEYSSEDPILNKEIEPYNMYLMDYEEYGNTVLANAFNDGDKSEFPRLIIVIEKA